MIFVLYKAVKYLFFIVRNIRIDTDRALKNIERIVKVNYFFFT